MYFLCGQLSRASSGLNFSSGSLSTMSSPSLMPGDGGTGTWPLGEEDAVASPSGDADSICCAGLQRSESCPTKVTTSNCRSDSATRLCARAGLLFPSSRLQASSRNFYTTHDGSRRARQRISFEFRFSTNYNGPCP